MTTPLTVELLTREGCGLCAKAAALLDELGASLSLEVVAVDIDRDPALLREFDWRVPVVRAGGRVLCEGLITAADLRAALGGAEVLRP
jgi:glutaredoxin